MTLATFAPAAGPGEPPAAGALPQVRDALLAAINTKYRTTPRHLQTAIGPSQVGHPCRRNLMFMASGRDRSQSWTDPWPSILGTAAHSWLGEALEARPGEWISERRVHIAPGLSGSADAFHVPTGTVVDFKVLGETAFRELLRHASSPAAPYWTEGDGVQYYTQIHSYGTGFANAGHPVRHVALAIFGRAKMLSAMYLVSWAYDPAVTQRALANLEAVRLLARAGVDPLVVPANPTKKGCLYCPFRGREADGLCESGLN